MNAQTHTLFNQLQAASEHARRIVEAEEMTERQRQLRNNKIRDTWEKKKRKEVTVSRLETILMGAVPVGKENASTYGQIFEKITDESIPKSSISSMLCVMVSKKQVQRTGPIRFYRYYRESK